MKASDLLVHCPEDEGIEYDFGVPGEVNADFMADNQKNKEGTWSTASREKCALRRDARWHPVMRCRHGGGFSGHKTETVGRVGCVGRTGFWRWRQMTPPGPFNR